VFKLKSSVFLKFEFWTIVSYVKPFPSLCFIRLNRAAKHTETMRSVKFQRKSYRQTQQNLEEKISTEKSDFPEKVIFREIQSLV